MVLLPDWKGLIMPRASRRPKPKRPKSACPNCSLNLGHLMNELQGKQLRRAGEDEKLGAIICPKCKTALIIVR
jgi:hypothetical protein